MELVFDSAPAAVAARHAAADAQLVGVPAEGTQPALRVPVRLDPGRLLCTHTCVIIHSLPAAFRVEGLGTALLSCAGYLEVDIRGEFVGELPQDMAAIFGSS